MVVILDADLKDSLEFMPGVVSAWREGADVELMPGRTRAGGSLAKRISHMKWPLPGSAWRPG